MSGYIQFVCFVVGVTDSGGHLFCKIAGGGGGDMASSHPTRINTMADGGQIMRF